MFQVSLPVSAGLPASFSIPWLVEAPPQSRPLSSRGVLPVYKSVPKFHFFIRTPVLLIRAHLVTSPSRITAQ